MEMKALDPARLVTTEHLNELVVIATAAETADYWSVQCLSVLEEE